MTKDGFWQKKETARKKHKEQGALGVGAVVGGGPLLGRGRAGKGSGDGARRRGQARGAEERQQWGWCAWVHGSWAQRSWGPCWERPGAPGPEPFHFLHVLTSWGFYAGSEVTGFLLLLLLLKINEQLSGYLWRMYWREVRSSWETTVKAERWGVGVRPQGERMEPSVYVGGGVRVETAGRADGLNVTRGG